MTNNTKMEIIQGAYTARTVSKMSLEEVANLLNEQLNEIRSQRLAVELCREREMRNENIINEIKKLLK